MRGKRRRKEVGEDIRRREESIDVIKLATKFRTVASKVSSCMGNPALLLIQSKNFLKSFLIPDNQ